MFILLKNVIGTFNDFMKTLVPVSQAKANEDKLERLPNQSNLTYVLNGKKNVFP